MKVNFSKVGCGLIRWGRGRNSSSLRCLLAMVALGPWLGTEPVAFADLPAPDNIVYGMIYQGTNIVPASATGFCVEARLTNGLCVARYRMGDESRLGNYYLLSLKIEEVAPRSEPSALLVGESFSVILSSNAVEIGEPVLLVAERGAVCRVDLGEKTGPALAGFELWAYAHGMSTASQGQDWDADGVGNYAEYIAGTNPTNSESKFLVKVGQAASATQVRFEAVLAEGLGYDGLTRHYELQRETNVSGTNWESVPGYEDIVGANQTVLYEPPATTNTLFFYRGIVRLSLP